MTAPSSDKPVACKTEVVKRTAILRETKMDMVIIIARAEKYSSLGPEKSAAYSEQVKLIWGEYWRKYDEIGLPCDCDECRIKQTLDAIEGVGVHDLPF